MYAIRSYYEDLDEIAAESEARARGPQAREGTHQGRLVESRHRRGATRVDGDPQVVEEIERAGEASHAPTCALGDRGEPAGVRNEQMA